MSGRGIVLIALACAGCYSGNRASRGINHAWVGHGRAEIVARWGAPAAEAMNGDTAVLQWSHSVRHVELPGGEAALRIDADGFDASATLTPGATWTSSTDVRARISPAGTIVGVDGPSLRWGAPRGANLRTGVVLGLHAGPGTLDDTATPLPSGGVYIGGMLGPRLAMIGDFLMVTGKDDDGGAIDFAWSLALQYWPAARVQLHAGPAMILDLDPGFDDAALGPGLSGGASFAAIRAGSFVLDLRLDLALGLGTAFGTAGIGVNLN